ncbi:MAG TPA: hypothetical protein PK916_10290 [Bacteroidota bacterium]|nr:hypothetical protein [Bacteroidota bacterium]
MAKQQTFADKNKNKSKSEFVSVKCIVSVYDANTESWKYREKMVRVKSTAELANMTF